METMIGILALSGGALYILKIVLAVKAPRARQAWDDYDEQRRERHKKVAIDAAKLGMDAAKLWMKK